MIVFCDTSALIKRYIVEKGSEELNQVIDKATIVAVTRITWVEAQAAFARRTRETPQDADLIAQAITAFEADWSTYMIVEVNQPLVEQAGGYADVFSLRAYDSVQLASAALLQKKTEMSVLFACYDARLCKAAQLLGLMCL
jgi:predicted nucleic acid-binding protein